MCKRQFFLLFITCSILGSVYSQNKYDITQIDCSIRLKSGKVSYLKGNKIISKPYIFKADSSDDRYFPVEKTEECIIFLKNRSFYKNVTLVGYTANSIKIQKEDVDKFVRINEINRIKFERPSGFWLGVVIGAGVSFGSCMLIGLIADKDQAMPWALMYGLISIVPGGLIGGLIGAIATPDDVVYDFSNANPKAKLNRLRYIMGKHSILLP